MSTCFPAAQELYTATGDPGVFAGEVVGKGVSVPVGQLIVGTARRKTEDELISFYLNYESPVVRA